MRTPSIKRFLIISITCAVLLVYAVISVVSYMVSKDELDELYDAHLKQVAETIASQTLQQSKLAQQPVSPVKSVQNEEVFYIRLIDKEGSVSYASHPKEQLTLTTPLGLSSQTVNNQDWRLYTLQTENGKIQVAQLLTGREVTIKETALSLVLSQLLFIPLLVIVILVVVNRALKPIKDLSDTIQQRDSDDLTPLNMPKTPTELMPFVQAFNGFMSKVSTMVETLKQFTADAAHELRTPITALKLQHALITKADSDADRNDAINSLEQGIARSERIVTQLLTLARMSTPDSRQSAEPISLVPIIKTVIESLLPLAQAKGIELSLNSSVNYTVVGVTEQIHLMIHNILENAIRYTPENGKVDIAISSSDAYIILEIKDSGPGIPSEDLTRVFERFYRSASKDTNGSGLGLAIVKNIATLHDARIELANLNPGLCFRVYLSLKNFPL